MQDLNDKVIGNELTAAEWNEIPSEIQNAITDSGQTLSSGDLTQLSKAIGSIAVDNKAAAVLLTPVNNKSYFIGGTDGGWFKGVTGGSGYSDNGGSYCGTQFIPTGGDGSAALVREGHNVIMSLYTDHFGVQGDGATVDDTAMQNILDAAAVGTKKIVEISPVSSFIRLTTALTKAAGVSIRGNGISSQLRQITTDTNIFTVNSAGGGFIKDLYLYGTGSGTGNGLVLSGSSNVNVSGVISSNHGGSGIAVYSSSNNVKVAYCTANDNGVGGIDINGSDYVTADHNYGSGNGAAGGGGAIALFSSNRCTLTGNICNNNSGFGIDIRYSTRSSVTGGSCNNNSYSGLSISSGATGESNKITVTGVNCEDNAEHGIVLDAGGLAYFIKYCTITGNTCTGNGGAVTTAGKGIYLEDNIYGSTVSGNTCFSNYDAGIEIAAGSRYNSVTGNTCVSNGTDTGLTDIERAGIRLTDTSIDGSENVLSNTLTGNTCYDEGGGTQKYGISIDKVGGGKDVFYTVVHSNSLRGNSVAGLVDEGTDNSVRDNEGWVTESSGTSAVANATTSVVVAHGLDVTPNLQDISLIGGEFSTNLVTATRIDTIGATNFTVHTNVDPGASGWDFGWKIAAI